MQAVAAAYEVVLTPPEIAVLCQKVENLVAGAPCGVMDQMAVACGEAGKLLKLLCQPAELLGATQLPEELGVWGIDSGVRHAVTGADYGTVRTAAFIGYRIIAEVEGLACETVAPGRVRIEDARWRGYLANIAPAEFAESYAAHLPELMSGAEFLQRYGGITDMVTAVNPERSYPVYQATRHPVEENARVVEFAALLADWRGGKQAERLGRLMYESHESYSACGLGAMATDAIVRLARDTPGLYGAKITGGGSGGTVAVLGRCDAAAAVAEVAAKYAEQSGYAPFVLAGSSAGARRVF
jgi:L-arabinokinase